MDTHRCPRCRRDLSVSEFNPRSTKGWIDAEGVRRSSRCAACVRLTGHENHLRDKARRNGELIVGYGLLDAAPFRKWLEERRRVFLSEPRNDANGHVIGWSKGRPIPTWFAAYVGVEERHLYRLLRGEMRRVRVDIVDQALVHEGTTMLWELYPELYPDMETAA